MSGYFCQLQATKDLLHWCLHSPSYSDTFMKLLKWTRYQGTFSPGGNQFNICVLYQNKP